jgi:hypothetical protein
MKLLGHFIKREAKGLLLDANVEFVPFPLFVSPSLGVQ